MLSHQGVLTPPPVRKSKPSGLRKVPEKVLVLQEGLENRGVHHVDTGASSYRTPTGQKASFWSDIEANPGQEGRCREESESPMKTVVPGGTRGLRHRLGTPCDRLRPAQGVIDFETWLRYLEEPSSAASSNRADSPIHMTVADSSPADRRRNAPGGPRNRLPPNREYEQAPRRMSDQTPVPAPRSARYAAHSCTSRRRRSKGPNASVRM